MVFLYRYSLYTMGILYFYYINNTYDALLLEIIKMTNLKNMKICYPFKGFFFLKKNY